MLKLIYGRLKDLTEQNEALRAENIALQDGSRAEEYRKHAAALQYQLDLLKRRFGLDLAELTALSVEPVAAPPALLVYNMCGRLLRIEQGLETGTSAHLSGALSVAGEAVRLLAVPANEELLLLFSSGRVSTCPVEEITLQPAGGEWSLEQAALPDEPHGGERLVCITPISRLALVDFFLQCSRRGYLKKTMTSISETIFENHYIGKGTVQRLDQPLDLTLCMKKELFVLVTYEELQRDVEQHVLRLQLVEHPLGGALQDLGPRVVVLVHAVPEAREPERVVRVLGPAHRLAHVAAVVADVLEHLHARLVGAAVQRAPQRVDAGRDRRVQVRLRGTDHAHRRRGAVLLVVGVQDQQLLQRVHDRRRDLVRLRRHREHHAEEVLDEVERVVGVEERLADRLLVRVRGDGRQLRHQAHDRELHLRRDRAGLRSPGRRSRAR